MRKRKLWIEKSVAALLSCTMLAVTVPGNVVSAKTGDNNSIVAEASKEGEASSEFAKTAKTMSKLSDYLVTFYGTTSVQYAIMDHGTVTVSGSAGYANKEMKLAPEMSTIYGIGSISKVFTTAAVMRLVDEGKVDLDEPVVTYIPEFTMEDERYKQITVRMLLNHSSGLLGSTLNNTMLFGDIDQTTTDHLLEMLSKQKLKADPGTVAVYCNDGFSLAELLVEHVTGIDFTTYLHQNILSELNMTDTYTAAENFVTKKIARNYSATGKRYPREVFNCIGAGGIYSTAVNLCEFAQMFMKDSAKILSKEAVEAMEAPEYKNGIWMEDEDETLSFGLGWDNVRIDAFEEYGIQALDKVGDTKFFHGSLIVLPEEEISMAILSSSGASTYDKAIGVEGLLTYLEEKGRIDRSKETQEPLLDTSLPSEPLPKKYLDYGGYYANNAAVYQVEITGEKMSMKTIGTDYTTEYEYYRDGWFKDKEQNDFLKLIKEENGAIYLYRKYSANLPKLGKINTGLFYAQRLENYDVDKDALKAWLDRSDNQYLIENEKYSSYVYSIGLAKLVLLDETALIMDQYLWMMKIVDANTMAADLQIPMSGSRDLSYYTCMTIDGKDYIKQNEYVYISTDDVDELSEAEEIKVSIPENGYAQYYKIPEDSDGRKLKVDVPEDAAFVVYSASGTLVRNSYLDKKTTVTLSKGGYLVLLGDAGAEFTIHTVK